MTPEDEWENLLRLMQRINDVYNREVVHKYLRHFPSAPMLTSVDLSRAQREPEKGIGGNRRSPWIAILKGNKIVILSFTCRFRKEDVQRTTIRIRASFYQGGEHARTAIRFESPSCWDQGNNLEGGDHDFYHIQFCGDRDEDAEERLPIGFENSWPTIPLNASSALELVWVCLLIVLGRKEAQVKFKATYQALPLPARNGLDGLIPDCNLPV